MESDADNLNTLKNGSGTLFEKTENLGFFGFFCVLGSYTTKLKKTENQWITEKYCQTKKRLLFDNKQEIEIKLINI